jgi:type I restriction enzyme, S subunit
MGSIDFEFPNADGKPYKSSGGAMVRSDLGDIPEGWQVGKLGDIALFNNGKSSPERSDDFNIPIYGSNGVIGKASKSNYQNIVIIGRVGSYCGSLYYFLDKCWVTDNAMIGRLINKTSHAFLYFILQTIKLNRLSTGSGQPLLNQTILSSIEWALPTNIYIESFENAVKSMFDKMLSSNNQIQTLTKTRDALLPKLMSGQLRVSE